MFLYVKLVFPFLLYNIIGHFSSDLYSKVEIQGATILFSVFILLYRYKYKCYLSNGIYVFYVLRKC